MAWAQFQRTFKKNTFLSFGVPFLVLLVGGSFALKHFAQLRYTFRKKILITREQAEEFGLNMKPVGEEPTLESEFEKMKKIDIDHWVNIRGPRPWEDSKAVQQAQKQSTSSNL